MRQRLFAAHFNYHTTSGTLLGLPTGPVIGHIARSVVFTLGLVYFFCFYWAVLSTF